MEKEILKIAIKNAIKEVLAENADSARKFDLGITLKAENHRGYYYFRKV